MKRDNKQPEQPPHQYRAVNEPAFIEPIVGKKRIGEMTADEYLQLVRDAQKAMGIRRVKR